MSGSVFLGLAFFALSFAVPTGAGLSGGMAGAGAVVLINAWTGRLGEEKTGQP
ncbi:MAG: hypothetical protein Q4C89_01505 [Deinococcus sp.]|uniref:hypothetical protein n=1 Tax=Deinococcus sp. TaxID=47478 RepID=UPI0026DD099A|nr:hypothetical protein [Deinococcus sp.]MDO4244685.1 hypothetical protein [Deinococcus sp.]